MGVKDKPSDDQKDPQTTPPGSQLNSKRTFEEFKGERSRSSSPSIISESESEEEEEKIECNFEISEQIDCLGPDTLWRNAEIIAVFNYSFIIWWFFAGLIISDIFI